MPNHRAFLKPLFYVPLSILFGYLVNQIPSASIPFPGLIALTVLCGVLFYVISETGFLDSPLSDENNSNRQSKPEFLVPIAIGSVLWTLVYFKVAPVAVEVACGYAGLILIVLGALMAVVSPLLRQQRDTSEDVNNQSAIRPGTRKKLLDSVSDEVMGRLHSSLHNRIYIHLSMEEQARQVSPPWSLEVKIGKQSSFSLPIGTSASQVFDRPDIAGKLLILGQPGAGKTTVLLQLAEVLLDRAWTSINEPIPFIVPLAAWQPKQQSFSQWFVSELKIKYGVRLDIGQHLLETNQLLPLLDGLDELPSASVPVCIEAINQFQQNYRFQHLVVCSRFSEYEQAGTLLQLNGAIYLQPLTATQIQQYILKVADSTLWRSIQIDPDLMLFAQTPLFLSVIALAYRGISLQEWQQLSSGQARQRKLFDAYIGQMLQERRIRLRWYRAGQEPSQQQTLRWLNWLSKKLQDKNQPEFWIENLQPTWLETRFQKRICQFLTVLIFGVSTGLTGGTSAGLFGGTSKGLIVGLIVGLFGGLSMGLSVGLFGGLHLELSQGKITPRDTLSFSWRNGLISGLLGGLIVGLGFGLTGELGAGLIDELITGLGGRLRFGLIAGLGAALTISFTAGTTRFSLPFIWRDALSLGLVFGLGSGLIAGLGVGLTMGLVGVLFGGLYVGKRTVDVKRRQSPNYGIWQSLISGLSVGLNLGLISGLFAGLSVGLRSGLVSGLFAGLSTGLCFGAVAALGGGLMVCIRHFALRFLLWGYGCTPWNYAHFLNYATDHLLLQKVGGGYRFIHDLLRDHIANSSCIPED